MQWNAVDDIAFAQSIEGIPPAPQLPDWTRIAKEPWVKEVILGLAGRFSELEALRLVRSCGRGLRTGAQRYCLPVGNLQPDNRGPPHLPDAG